jgi:predicted nucleic acid-binding protein
MQKLGCTELPRQSEADDLAKLYVSEEILSEKHIDDLTHVAYAVLARCDYIISWNMKHLVRIRTIDRVNAVNFLYHYPGINIVTPEFITGVIQ